MNTSRTTTRALAAAVLCAMLCATAHGEPIIKSGDKLMARGVLRALGIPEEKMPEIEAAWRTIRGYWEYRISVSADEAKAIDERAKAKGCKVEDLLRDALLGR